MATPENVDEVLDQARQTEWSPEDRATVDQLAAAWREWCHAVGLDPTDHKVAAGAAGGMTILYAHAAEYSQSYADELCHETVLLLGAVATAEDHDG